MARGDFLNGKIPRLASQLVGIHLSDYHFKFKANSKQLLETYDLGECLMKNFSHISAQCNPQEKGRNIY